MDQRKIRRGLGRLLYTIFVEYGPELIMAVLVTVALFLIWKEQE